MSNSSVEMAEAIGKQQKDKEGKKPMKNKKTFSKALCLFAAIGALLCASGCDKSDMVNYNLNRQANAFETYRQFTLVNLRSDKVLMEVEGYISISNSTEDNAETELQVTIQTGPNEYKRHYCYIGAQTCYLVEQKENSHTDPYHWEIRVFWSVPEVIFG